ncbi:hypothetical protein ASPBRDRAFT_132114, partial [Aspergillus brasiliensis CBS 101740]
VSRFQAGPSARQSGCPLIVGYECIRSTNWPWLDSGGTDRGGKRNEEGKAAMRGNGATERQREARRESGKTSSQQATSGMDGSVSPVVLFLYPLEEREKTGNVTNLYLSGAHTAKSHAANGGCGSVRYRMEWWLHLQGALGYGSQSTRPLRGAAVDARTHPWYRHLVISYIHFTVPSCTVI